MVLIKEAEEINIEDAKRDLQELERIKEEEAPIKERLSENLNKLDVPPSVQTGAENYLRQTGTDGKKGSPTLQDVLETSIEGFATADLDAPTGMEGSAKDETKSFDKWLSNQYGNEADIVKTISRMKGTNLTEAMSYIPEYPSAPIVGGKCIPDLIKELKMIRRELKGEHRDKVTKASDHLITAYEEYIQKTMDSIYWLRPYQSIMKTLALKEEKLAKLYYIKDGKTRGEFVELLCKMWEDSLDKKDLDFGHDFADLTKSIKDSRKLFNSKLKEISHQSIRKSKKQIIQDTVTDIICGHPGITSNQIHNKLPLSFHKITSPQSISKMVKKINTTKVDDGYYLLPKEIKKDLYSYVAGFIDSDGYITMDSKTSPRVGMIATGDRGRGFFQELEKELKCGRLHLDQKVGENNRSQHRLNFYSQNDIGVILEKCLPHFRMKKAQAELVLEAIRIKQGFKKQDWAKPRLEEIFKLIKYENWKDARNKTEFVKYGIDPEVVVKYHDNNKMSLMDELESGVE